MCDFDLPVLSSKILRVLPFGARTPAQDSQYLLLIPHFHILRTVWHDPWYHGSVSYVLRHKKTWGSRSTKILSAGVGSDTDWTLTSLHACSTTKSWPWLVCRRLSMSCVNCYLASAFFSSSLSNNWSRNFWMISLVQHCQYECNVLHPCSSSAGASASTVPIIPGHFALCFLYPTVASLQWQF